MTVVGYIALLSWPVICLVVFAAGGVRVGLAWSFAAGWLLLPVGSISLVGFPNFTKETSMVLAAGLGAVLMSPQKLVGFRLRLFQLPAFILPAAGFVASIVNDLGVHDGLSTALTLAIVYSVPFLLGFLFLGDQQGARYVALGIIIGGLCYIPLCAYEMRMSPQLHYTVYGFHPNAGGMSTTMRFGGWRPMVFTQSGLALALWMAAASLVGWWLWTTGTVRRLAGIRMPWIVVGLFVTTVLCRSLGALVLLASGIAVLWFTRQFQSRLALALLILIAPTYIVTRMFGLWDGGGAVELAAMIDADRAQSLQFRLENEDLLVTKAWERPAFGWGGWGRARVFDDWGADITTTDGRWIIQFGETGAVGMTSLFAMLLLPCSWLVLRYPGARLATTEFAPILSLAVIAVLYAIDRLPNAMENPVFMLGCGSVVGFLGVRKSSVCIETDVLASHQKRDGIAPVVPTRVLHPGAR